MDELVAWFRSVLDDEEQAARDAPPGPWRAQPPSDQTAWDSQNDGWEVVSDAYRPDQIGYHVVDVGDHVDINTRRGGVADEYRALYIARHDPAAVLADIEAKRAVLDYYEETRDTNPESLQPPRKDLHAASTLVGGMQDGLELAVRTLARAYRHRPGWKSEWE